MQAPYYKKENDIKNGKLQQKSYASSSKNIEDNERLFVVRHVMNSMAENIAKGGDVLWYVDSSASNHMTSHG